MRDFSLHKSMGVEMLLLARAREVKCPLARTLSSVLLVMLTFALTQGESEEDVKLLTSPSFALGSLAEKIL